MSPTEPSNQPHQDMQFVITFASVFLALILFEFLKAWPAQLFGFIKPQKVVWSDLHKYSEGVNKQLGKISKIECFPKNIDFPPISNTLVSRRLAKEIISGLLEKNGWVIIPTDQPNIIKVDIPRVRSL